MSKEKKDTRRWTDRRERERKREYTRRTTSVCIIPRGHPMFLFLIPLHPLSHPHLFVPRVTERKGERERERNSIE